MSEVISSTSRLVSETCSEARSLSKIARVDWVIPVEGYFQSFELYSIFAAQLDQASLKN